jgi:hypothetical protein
MPTGITGLFYKKAGGPGMTRPPQKKGYGIKIWSLACASRFIG